MADLSQAFRANGISLAGRGGTFGDQRGAWPTDLQLPALLEERGWG